MAKGGKCPECSFYLFASNEQHEERGSWVWYECADRTCNYKIKKFESNGKD